MKKIIILMYGVCLCVIIGIVLMYILNIPSNFKIIGHIIAGIVIIVDILIGNKYIKKLKSWNFYEYCYFSFDLEISGTSVLFLRILW